MESVVSHFRKCSMSMHLVTTSVTLVQGQKMDAEKNDIPGLDQRGQRQLDCRSEAPNFSPAWFFSGNSQLRKLSASRSMSLTFWLWSGNVLEVYIKKLWKVDECRGMLIQEDAIHGLVQHPRALRWWHLRWFSPAQRDIFQTLSDGPSKQNLLISQGGSCSVM